MTQERGKTSLELRVNHKCLSMVRGGGGGGGKKKTLSRSLEASRGVHGARSGELRLRKFWPTEAENYAFHKRFQSLPQ